MQQKKPHPKRVKVLRIAIPTTALLLAALWFFVISPGMFSSQMLNDIYPSHSRDNALKNSSYVPDIPVKDISGNKAVVLLREVNYDRGSNPVSWQCNNSLIPDAFKTNDPNQVKYVVYANKVRVSAGKYTNGTNASRQGLFVSIIDRSTGKVLDAKEFLGAAPPAKIRAGQGIGLGPEPSKDEIVKWVSHALPS